MSELSENLKAEIVTAAAEAFIARREHYLKLSTGDAARAAFIDGVQWCAGRVAVEMATGIMATGTDASQRGKP